MALERLGNNQWDLVNNFIRTHPNFMLEGPLDVPLIVERFAAVFPNRGGFIISGGNERELCLQILDLEVSDRIKRLDVWKNQNARVNRLGKSLDNFYSQVVGWPTRALVFGTVRDTRQEFVLLGTTHHVAPEQALDDIKSRAEVHLAKLEGIL